MRHILPEDETAPAEHSGRFSSVSFVSFVGKVSRQVNDITPKLSSPSITSLCVLAAMENHLLQTTSTNSFLVELP